MQCRLVLSTSSSVGGLGSVGILAGLGLADPGYPSGSNPYRSKSSFEVKNTCGYGSHVQAPMGNL